MAYALLDCDPHVIVLPIPQKKIESISPLCNALQIALVYFSEKFSSITQMKKPEIF